MRKHNARLTPLILGITARVNAEGNGYLDFSAVRARFEEQLALDPARAANDADYERVERRAA